MSARTIARRILGKGGVLTVALTSTDALLAKVKGNWRIAVRPRCVDANFVIAHELGHYAICVLDGRPEHEESEANDIAARLLAPSALMAKLHAVFGEQLAPTAKALDLTQSCVVLRIGEVRGEDRVVVAPDHVRARSFGGFASAPEPVLRAYAARPPKGLAKVRLGGSYDRGRVALRAS